ncbi:helix-turn-helix transcriptional regulator [bacterium]|nr:helix-turn-helix transcriptional regulator [bacterium]
MSTEEFLIEFAKNLRKIRKSKKLSQEKLGLLSDVDRVHIGRIERLERKPSLEVVHKLSKGLQISIVELVQF